MAPARRLRILALLAAAGEQAGAPVALCEVAASVVGVSGAGIMLMSGDTPSGAICSTDAVSHRIESLQYELGEGPCVDAFTLARPILAPDLRIAEAAARWPAFAGMAVQAGACALFGFPLQVGSVKIGAMNLYGAVAGDLTDEQHADALVMADIVAEAVLLLQANAQMGDLATALSAGDLHLVVHQAAGMVSVQLGVTLPVALARLRAHAFGHDVTLDAVARDVVERRLRFDHDGRE